MQWCHIDVYSCMSFDKVQINYYHNLQLHLYFCSSFSIVCKFGCYSFFLLFSQLRETNAALENNKDTYSRRIAELTKEVYNLNEDDCRNVFDIYLFFKTPEVFVVRFCEFHILIVALLWNNSFFGVNSYFWGCLSTEKQAKVTYLKAVMLITILCLYNPGHNVEGPVGRQSGPSAGADWSPDSEGEEEGPCIRMIVINVVALIGYCLTFFNI